MGDGVILVNGVPGAGKSTLARRLGAELGLPVVSKDDLKEALADAVPATFPLARLGPLAADLLWEVAAGLSGPVILESFWLADRDRAFAAAGLARCGRSQHAEVWCDVPVELARARYEARIGHVVHADRGSAADWGAWRHAEPLTSDAIRVDTSRAVDVAALAQVLGARLASAP
ncbi:ATP-binding protein [Microbacterium sp. zg.Y625]|uniref:AAA family ATPase n=1 Tax=Microbacterium jiangjiandongii TaxID=3049071 RepID=UPI00214D1373|nr:MULTISPECIES: ATP-binding protein [unclassified Microbacterium]MCR2792165.1 ATP-binding protein [Microbacterium sp. zg.Y625]MCR2814954.1 ATP-binding protein [Microbacterium sp. zg.Y843]WIM24969.1 ATP-binding protein [Microbacterium sp. zg-Y625]